MTEKKQLSELSDQQLWELFPIILKPHNALWKNRYIKEETSLKKLLGKTIVRISHIGSTAVDNLIAKPTIDILMEIQQKTDLCVLMNKLKKRGYMPISQPDKPPPHLVMVKGYTSEGFKGQAWHLHIRYTGDWDELYFRDYLEKHGLIVQKYGRLKIYLKEKYEHDRDSYTQSKTDFIKLYTKKARLEFSKKYRLGNI